MTKPKRKERICVMDGLTVWDVREEIVRCRDCEWATPSEDPHGQEIEAYSCAHWAGYADSRYDELWVDGGDFCSYGERRES